MSTRKKGCLLSKKKKFEPEDEVIEEAAKEEPLIVTTFTTDGFPAQQKFIEAALSGKYRTCIIGGSIFSGKTSVMLTVFLILARIFPNSKWAIMRHNLTKLRQTTLEVFRKVCPSNFLKKYNGQTWEAEFTNGSRFLFLAESDKLDKAHRLQGLNINGIGFDEFSEISKETFELCQTRVGTWSHAKKKNANGELVSPPELVLGATNPIQNWIKDEFYTKSAQGKLEEGIYFQKIAIAENPYVTQKFLDDKRKQLEDAEYNKYILGSWEVGDHDDQLIPWTYINQCVPFIPQTDETRAPIYYLGVDYAGRGEDKCVFTLLKDNNLYCIEAYEYTHNAMDVVERVKGFIDKYGITHRNVVIDSISNNIADILASQGIYVTPFIGNASVDFVSGIMSFANLRSLAYWALKEELKDKQLGGLQESAYVDGTTIAMLKSELAAVLKDSDNKCFAIESKKNFRKANGKSPDYADSFKYANWARIAHRYMPSMEMFVLPT